MKILLTGGSSFTGLWFAEALAARGFHVTAPLQRKRDAYTGLRATRVQRLSAVATIVDDCPFGSDAFLALVASQNFDALCHHAAQVTDYKSPNFDAIAAVRTNTLNLPQILAAAPNLRNVILTSSAFEADEGASNTDESQREAFSPYGLSKTLTASVFRFTCAKAKIPLTRFIIATPFGPFEEPRFGHYLMTCWAKRETAAVKTPDYVRDNVPVSLLAKAYADTVSRVLNGETVPHIAPSFYAESNSAFTTRLADAMRARLSLACAVDLQKQTDFAEPLSRINTDRIDATRLGWDERTAWDELAAYYRTTYLS